MLRRVVADPHNYSDRNTDEARKRPKFVSIVADEYQLATSEGFLVYLVAESDFKQKLYLFGAIALLMFFLLFRVWPEWLRLVVWYISWYFLVFLIGTAILRVIVWFLIFHVGVDFWIFPNYWADEDSILDSFRPPLSVDMREDMFDWKMGIVRIISIAAISNGAYEFVREPQKLNDLKDGAGEAWNDVFEWGQNKFMGVADNSTML